MSDYITNGELRSEAERLVEENEDLRGRIAELEKANGQLRFDYEAILKFSQLVLKDNDQLIELAVDIVYRMPCKTRQLAHCRTCPRNRYPDGCMIPVRMRELGIVKTDA